MKLDSSHPYITTTIGYLILALTLGPLSLGFGAETTSTPNSKSEPCDALFQESNDSLLEFLSDNESGLALGKTGSLGAKIRQYDSFYTAGEWDKVYAMRSDSWKADEHLPLWKNQMIHATFVISKLFVLDENPFPSPLSQKYSSAFELIKVAELRDIKTSTIAYKFFTEVWVYENNNWVIYSGVYWDGARMPYTGVPGN
jgi:hypothetical protein